MGGKNNKYRYIKLIIVSIVIGLAVVLLSSLQGNINANEVNKIERGNKKETISLLATSKYGESEMELEVLPYRISDEDLEEMLLQFKKELLEEIKGKNNSLDNITYDLNLVDSLDQFPFEVQYRFNPRGYISEKGEIIEAGDKSTRIEIIMTYSYDDYEYTDSIWVNLSALSRTEKEVFESELINEIREKNELNRKDAIDLPEMINGEAVIWKVKKQNRLPAVIILAVALVVYCFSRTYLKEREKEKQRQEILKREYPGFASKYSLLASTGLPHRQIIERMAADYAQRGKTNIMFEELRIVVNETQSGLSLTDSLNNLGQRCKMREMTHFVSLINQSLRKGGDNVAQQIKDAANDSIEMEKEETRKRIEKAGTKLLFPMSIILILVFVIIMIPAFNSFSM